MSKKKVNPRRVPVSKAELDATDLAVETALAMFLTVLRDREGYGPKRLKRVWDGIQDLTDSVTKGYVSLADLKTVLRDEAGIEVR